jgi:hypothetical protein
VTVCIETWKICVGLKICEERQMGARLALTLLQLLFQYFSPDVTPQL